LRIAEGNKVTSRDTEEFFFDLPDDPEDKLVVFESMMREIMDQNTNGDNWAAERSYMEALHAFSEVFGLGVLENLPLPPVDNSEFNSYYYEQSARIRTSIIKIKLRRTARIKQQSDNLLLIGSDAKAAIRKLLDAIKGQIDVMTLSDAKRGQLIAKLNAFYLELDQKLTHTEAFFSFVVDASRTLREAGAELKPLTDRIDRILDLFDKAEKWVTSLPKWRENKQIEGPKKRIEGPKGQATLPTSSDDEDIPF